MGKYIKNGSKNTKTGLGEVIEIAAQYRAGIIGYGLDILKTHQFLPNDMRMVFENGLPGEMLSHVLSHKVFSNTNDFKNMTPEQFCYWLQGRAELKPDEPLSADEWKSVREHLQLVFRKETRTCVSYSPPNPYGHIGGQTGWQKEARQIPQCNVETS